MTGKELLEEYKKKKQGNVSSEGTSSTPFTGSQLLEEYKRIKKAIEIEDIVNSDDFASKSGYVSTKADNWWKKLTSSYGLGYDDLTYEYINNQNNLRDEINSKYKTFSSDNIFAEDESDFKQKGYDFIKEQEVALYNYYYNTEGKYKAQEYLDSLEDELVQRKAGKEYEALEGNTLKELFYGVVSGADQWRQGTENFGDYLVGGDGFTSSTQYVSGMVRDDLADDGFKVLGSSVGQMGYDLINTTTNMLPSILFGTVTGGLGGAVAMGVPAIGNAYTEMRKLGYSADQARAYATLVGISEAGLQYALGGISKLGGKISGHAVGKLVSKFDNAIAKAAIQLGGNMASEGLEEGIQTVLEPAFKALVTGEDFESPEWEEVFYSALLGALSAGTLEGMSTIKNTVSNIKSDIQASKMYGDSVQDLLIEAVDIGGEAATTADKYLAKYEKKGKLSGANINAIINANEQEMIAQDKGKIKATVEAKLTELGETGDVSTIADVLVKYATGEKLTSKDWNILNKSKTGYQVATDLNRDNLKSGGVANDWAVDIGTERINADVYNRGVYDLAKMMQDQRDNVGKASVAKELAESKGASEVNVAVSDSGKTMYYDADAKDYLDADIKRVVSTKGGIKVELDNGKTVKASDLEYASREEGVVFEMLARMDVTPETANEILNTFKPTDANQAELYYDSIPLAYRMGLMNNEQGLKYINLPDAQKRIVYNRGRIDAITNAKERDNVRATASTKTNAEASKSGKNGIIYEGDFVYDESKANDFQKAGMAGAEAIAKTTNLEVHVFESFMEDGKRVAYVNGKLVSAPNGYFTDGNKIYIDINAGKNAEGAMLYALAHEVTHYIRKWNAQGFKDLADFLIAEYGKHGVDITALIQRQKDKIKKRYNEEGKTLPNDAKLFDMAYEELVADAMSDMLADPNAYKKLEKFKKKNFKAWKKLGEVIKQVLDKLKNALGLYREYSPVAEEAIHVRDFSVEAYNKLQDLYIKAFVEADANYEASGGEVTDLDGNESEHLFSDKSMVEGAGLQFIINENGSGYKVLDKAGKPVKSVTAEMIVDSPLGNLVTMAKNEGFLGKGKEATAAANKQYKFLADLVNMCINYNGIVPIWETAGTMVFSSMKSNSDKQYGLTIDFSTVCKKTQAIVDAMSEAMLRLGRGLTRSEVETIYLEVGKAGESTPCPVCYVFSRWMGIGGILDQISRFQDKYSSMSEKSLQKFIADIQERIEETANTPGKDGKVKSKFFTAKGEISEGQVIAELKSKASSKAASALNAIAKNSDTQLKIQELEALMEAQDSKGAKKTAKAIEKLKNKLVDVTALEKDMRDANDTLEEYEAYQWLTRTLMMESDGKWIKNSAFKPVPKDILFDLNKGDKFAEGYPLSWAFRTGKGASAGKAIVPYADARVGEAIQAVANQSPKDIKIGLELNPFMNSDTAGRLKILKSAIAKQARQNLVGGQRYQSTSDFRYEYGSDYLITFLEMQAIGAKVQLYTKVIEAVDFLASMGADCNLSVMPLSDGFITLPDGTKKLVYSSVTGINAEAAIKKSHEYNNVQLILVGISDEHIRLALEGTDVTFVIPFHGSGNSVHQIQALMNLLGENLDVTTAQDYTLVQSDHVSPHQTKEQKAMWNLRVKIIQGKASTITAAEQALLDKNSYLKDLYRRFYIDKNAEEYGVGLTTGQAEQIFPYEYWDKALTYAEADKNGERFKEYCASMGIIPRFSGMNSSGEYVGFGDFTNDKGYWKLLIDRPMYDNTYDSEGNWTGYGKYHEQARINCSNFNVKHLDPEYGSATYGEVMSKENDPKKTNKIVDAALKQFENNTINDVRSEGDTLYSVREIVGDSGKNYGIGVYLDSQLLSNLSDAERIEMVKEYVKELGGSVFTAYDNNHKAVDVHIVESNKKFRNKSGKKVSVNRDMTNYLNSKVKQEAIALVDELIFASIYRGTEPATHPHDWVDNNGTNDWDVWTTYIQDKENTVWEAKLRIANSTNGEKILYDIFPIEMVEQSRTMDTSTTTVEQSVKSDTSTTDGSITHPDGIVKEEIENILLSDRDSEGNTLSKEQQEFFKDSKIRDKKGNLLVVRHGTDADFNIFDFSKSGKNGKAEGYGFYFSDEPEITNRYGAIQKELYLNITKPLYNNKRTITKAELKKFTNALIDFDIEKYKSDGLIWQDSFLSNFIDTYEFKKSRQYAVQEFVNQIWDYNTNDQDLVFEIAQADGRMYDSSVMKEFYNVLTDSIGYDGIIAEWTHPDGASNVYVTFSSEQSKYTTNKTPTSDPDMRFSDRDTDTLTDKDRFFISFLQALNETDESENTSQGISATETASHETETKPQTWMAEIESFYTTLLSGLGNKEKSLFPSVNEILKSYSVNRVGESAISKAMMAAQNLPNRKHIQDGILQIDNMLRAVWEEARKFSERDSNSVSNRTLLANALDSVAQNDIERAKLAQYKKKIALIESEQKKLNDLKARANAIRFTKGRTSAETKQMHDLEFEANQTANRINTYDKQLLNLASTKALKNVLEREKANLRKRLEQEGKKALNAQRAKNAETVREIMNRNTESRKKAVESRHKTEMRHKIKKVVSDLNKLLLNPTKEQHVPIGLQKVVADALDAINMDTMNAEERVKYYNDLIAKSKNPDEIKMLTKTRDFFADRDASFKEKITALKNAYAEFKESDDPLIRNAHNDAIADLISNTASAVGNNSLKDMSYGQLEAVYDMYTAVLATVRNANKMFKEGRQETVTENSEAVKVEVKEVGGHQERVLKATKFLKKAGWDMLKPITAMKVIGSKTLAKLFDNVRAAEDTWAVDVNEAKEFYEAISKKYGYDKWDFKTRYNFKDSAGAEYSISLEQMMSLYAYSKREQADEHLEFGGFIFDDAIEVTEKNKVGIPLKYEVNDANPHRLGQIQMMEVIGKLTQEQKAFIDEMQTYLSEVMGAKGNEVSLALYDIKLYKEKNYFPLKTARYFREFDPEKSGTPKIKNSGFSKKTVPQAGNPIVLSNFMDVWASHVNDMSMYHAFVLPLEDFMRVYNYSSTAGGYDSVQQYIKNAYGSQANQYIERLMDDLNGGARVDSSAGIINKGISLFKKSAVFASASVVIQQPSAIARAWAYIDPKYFGTSVGSALNLKQHKDVWAEVKKYAPVAVIKEMGYFDTGMGRSTVEWIKGNKTIKDKMDDFLSKAPAMADELSWSYIWLAVKKEIQATTSLTPGSEEFLNKVGERFTEIITNTQVYDSVLARSGMMRSKDTGMKMATAFMAEPTTTVNMMVDGIIQGKRGNKKFLAATVGAVSASIILNSILVALVYAARDDDEDETYAEKYVGSLTSELLDGFNPLTYIPFVKDIWSIAQGYDVERSDMSVVSNLWESIEGLFNENKSGWEKVADATGAISSLFGIPLKNIIRDAKGMYNLTKTLLSGTPTTGAGISEAIGDAFTSSIPLWDRLHESDSKSDKLYDAIMSGDKNHISRIRSGYATEQAFETAMRQALRDNDSRIKEAAKARYEGNIAEYTRIAKEIIGEGNFSQDIVVGAINAELNAIKRGETTEEEPAEEKDEVTSIYSGSDINSAFDNGDYTLGKQIIADLIETKVANGMDEKNAKSSLRSSMTSYWKPLYKEAYQSGNTSEMARIRQILYASGLYGTVNEVVKTAQGWLKS